MTPQRLDNFMSITRISESGKRCHASEVVPTSTIRVTRSEYFTEAWTADGKCLHMPFNGKLDIAYTNQH